MSRILAPLGAAIAFTAANTVSDAQLVRVYAVAASVVTMTNSANTVVGTFTMPAASVEYVAKATDDTLTGTTTISCTPAAHRG